MDRIEIIDCFVGRRHGADVARDIGRLRRAGLRHMAVVGMVNTHLDAGAVWRLIPDFVENRGNPLLHEAEDLLELARVSDHVIIPLVDTRCLSGDVSPLLRGYIEQGFKGIKGIYLADEGNDIGVRGVPEVLGITLEQYHRREWEIFAFAQDNDLPLLYHMDARRYGDVMAALLDDFPRVRVNFPHFGISRKAFGAILDRYANVYTDIANMLPHIKNNPASYRDFIMHYPDRVCFASDAFLYQADTVLDYVGMVRELRLPQEIETQLFHGNPAQFLGRALGG